MSDADDALDGLEEQPVEQQVAELRNVVRDQQRELAVLRDELHDLRYDSVTKQSIAFLADALSGDVDDYSKDPMQYTDHFEQIHDRVESVEKSVSSHETRLENVGTKKSQGKEDAWLATVTAAHNLYGMRDENTGPNQTAYLYIGNLEQATGYSDRRCSQLIDEWAEEKPGTKKRDYRRGETQTRGNSRRKRLAVDLEVWPEE